MRSRESINVINVMTRVMSTCSLFPLQVAQQMVEQQLGDRLRGKIQDDRTHDNVSYYAQSFSDADYGTTYVAVLAQNGDAVSMTNTINHRLVNSNSNDPAFS